MHTHQSIWKGERPAFAGNLYADLSETALYYIGGILRHAKALNAFTNPTTKQLQSASSPALRRRCCSPTRRATARPAAAFPMSPAQSQAGRGALPGSGVATPISPFAADDEAGLRRVQNRIHPGDAMDRTSTTCRPRN